MGSSAGPSILTVPSDFRRIYSGRFGDSASIERQLL
ncbi:hypothetical protein RB4035 [Rhodopirellula baltica SH 1]|uniref:Uncharacterized protein n=1 Tax=Rhodopirellula baltica (strain DSM 10527 / NCIMB 13988 / SH1) TaxID=243090 RepID=Q7UT82_RHOBA|nr:hypothetical protein RB4035 [Rhodopirellula baltica SH 1]